MIVAVLFNSDHAKYGGVYGHKIRDSILKTGVLQASLRHLKIRHGDVLIQMHARTAQQYEKLAEDVYFSTEFSLIQRPRLEATYFSATIYAWTIQNITIEIAKKLNELLLLDDAYLGLHSIDYSLSKHLALYRNSMIPYCRLHGGLCQLFYSMGETENIDEYEQAEVLASGFNVVNWEDLGAHGSFLDPFDTLIHFQQVRDVQRIFSNGLPAGDDASEELVMLLEDLNPKLLNTLGAAVRALDRAQNEEDYAHVGLSGRRYIEQIADLLFSPSSEKWRGRDVGADKHKNRLWAYVEEAKDKYSLNEVNLLAQGEEIDRLFKEVNAILHANLSKTRVLQCFYDLGFLTISLLSLSPIGVSHKYSIYDDQASDFVDQLIKSIA